MAPSSRLRQGIFGLDLLLADNFIRAAEEAGLEHVIISVDYARWARINGPLIWKVAWGESVAVGALKWLYCVRVLFLVQGLIFFYIN